MTASAVKKSDIPADERLLINEVFFSIQGESTLVGCPTVFVRLTGCPLRCVYCDTEYAFHQGDWHSFQQLIDQISGHGTPYVCVTGGEPLAQKNCAAFLTRLCDAGFQVSLETSGAYDLKACDPRVIKVMDIKTPASKESHRNLFDNLKLLKADDQVKFVICDRADYEWAKQQIARHNIAEICPVLLSPSFEQVTPKELAEWILEDQLPVRLQLQLHKILWGDVPGH